MDELNRCGKCKYYKDGKCLEMDICVDDMDGCADYEESGEK